MCTIAGYIGEKNAAPILIEMMRTIEGFDSGFFTGIATIHEGKLYYQKVIGDLDQLLKKTNATSLPGKIGIIHSRTNGNGEGSVEQGHPFVAKKDGELFLAHVSNGGAGFFADRRAGFGKIADELTKENYELRSKERFKNPNITTSDGDAVHISDIITQYTMKLMDEGVEPVLAAERAMVTIPSDDVDLNISLAHPESIVFSKMSQPMTIGFCPHGVYMSTTALAFPEDAGVPIVLPSFVAGEVRQGGYSLKPFDTLPCTYEPFDASAVIKAYPMIAEMIEKAPMSIGEIRPILRTKLFPNTQSAPTSLVIYEVLRVMKKQGILKWENRRVPGRCGLTAPCTYFYIN